MTFLYEQVDLGQNIIHFSAEAFKGFQRTKTKPDLISDPRTLEAIKYGLQFEEFTSEEIFRAYPIISKDKCRELTRVFDLNTTIEDVTMAVYQPDIYYFFELFRTKNLIPQRMYSDMVDFRIIGANATIVTVQLTFFVPKIMSPEGWLLVLREEEEVFG